MDSMTVRQDDDSGRDDTRSPTGRIDGGADVRGGDLPMDVDSAVLVDVFANMQLGLGVWRLEDIDDENTFRLIASNPAARQIGRMPPGSLIGATLAEALPGAIETDLVAIFAEVVRSGTARDLGVIHYGDKNIPEADYRVKAFPISNDCVGTMFEVVDAAEPTVGAGVAERYRLTKRETTILYYIAAGRANKEIATALEISVLTVAKHVSSILKKMAVHSRTEAAVLALRPGALGP